MSRPVTTYRVGWARPVFHARRALWLLVAGAPTMRRRTILRFARADVPKNARQAVRMIWHDGLIPPWQAEVDGFGCTCNARRGWTERQAVSRVVVEHNERAGLRRCGNSVLRLHDVGDGRVSVYHEGTPAELDAARPYLIQLQGGPA